MGGISGLGTYFACAQSEFNGQQHMVLQTLLSTALEAPNIAKVA